MLLGCFVDLWISTRVFISSIRRRAEILLLLIVIWLICYMMGLKIYIDWCYCCESCGCGVLILVCDI